MAMKRGIVLLAAGMLSLCALAQAQTKAKGRKTIAVDEVKVGKSLRASLSGDERSAYLGRVADALDRHVVSAIVGSRKFTVVGRRDLQSLVDEQDLAASGVVGKKAARENDLTGAEYKLVVFLDSFQETKETAMFNGIRRMKRRVQASAQSTIYDSSTGEALDAANIQTELVDIVDINALSERPGGRTDELIPKITRDLAEKTTAHLLAFAFPAKVIDVTGTTVTINRGAGFFQVGDTVKAHTPGKTVTDPDTGEKIAIKGKFAGTVRITSVEPNYAQGEIVPGSGAGIAVGSQVSKESQGEHVK